MKYCAASDCYVRESDKGAEVYGWQQLVFEARNVFRKEELDWKMVYLAREEGTDTAEISWKFDFRGRSRF